ncbi:hypothetical protein HNP86_001870 [Methanococcus maripaludis]|uniref:Uncharacterized protein n=1 Tax=Methanococcus maripaludis TaxID=39152 RepID=A0A7J9NWM6_METMI|nr:hypothetical protein [Methanococcus maripaludis]MBA2851711.1 hypothetical protein [Methanococcus maripaludis]
MVKVNSNQVNELNSEYGVVFEVDPDGILEMKPGLKKDVLLVNMLDKSNLPETPNVVSENVNITDEVSVVSDDVIELCQQTVTFIISQHTINIYPPLEMEAYDENVSLTYSTPQATISITQSEV